MDWKALACSFVGVAVLSAPNLARAKDHEHDDSCMVHMDASKVSTRKSKVTAKLMRSSGGGGVTVYLNGRGGRVSAGMEDSGRARSQIVWSRGLRSISVPRYSRGQASFDRVATCVRDQFKDYNVNIVESRPSGGEYITAMIGGRPGMLSLGGNVGGIAPYTAGVIDRATVFVFEAQMHSERSICETTAHEIGHALGLDHSRLCSDTMSYGHCGPKRFRDEASVCGEFGGRGCGSGAARQNSHERLVAHVGPSRSGATVRPRNPKKPPRRLPPSKRPPRTVPATPPRGAAPRVALVAGDRHNEGDSVYMVSVRARDTDGIAGVELLWTDGASKVAVRCGKTPRNLPVKCSRKGDKYTFALHVGYGHRAYAVRVTDGRGKETVTKPRVASFW